MSKKKPGTGGPAAGRGGVCFYIVYIDFYLVYCYWRSCLFPIHPCFPGLHITSLNSFAYWTKVQPRDIATFISSGEQDDRRRRSTGRAPGSGTEPPAFGHVTRLGTLIAWVRLNRPPIYPLLSLAGGLSTHSPISNVSLSPP